MSEQIDSFQQFQMLIKAARKARDEGRMVDAAKLHQLLLYSVRGWLPPPDSLEDIPLFGSGNPPLEKLF